MCIRDRQVDTIVTDQNGRAASKALPLGRYTIREVKAPNYYSINPTTFTAYLEYPGQIVEFEVLDESCLLYTSRCVYETDGKECEQRSEHSKIGTPKDRAGHGNQRAWAGEIKGSGADTITKEGDEKR